jgi:RNA polymerase sigma factor (sigma-70 family)
MSSLQEMTLVLLDRAKEGDEKAFSELFIIYRPKVYFIISRMVKNKHDVEDLTMEVLEKVFNNLDAYKPTYSFKTWLDKVTKNYTLDYIRKRNIQFIHIDQDFINIETPERKLIGTEQLNILEKCIDKLKSHYKSVVDLYCFDKLSYKDISKRLNVTEITCRSYLFRARRKIRYEYNGTN